MTELNINGILVNFTRHPEGTTCLVFNEFENRHKISDMIEQEIIKAFEKSYYWDSALPYLKKTLTKQHFDELGVVIDKESMALLNYLASDEESVK